MQDKAKYRVIPFQGPAHPENIVYLVAAINILLMAWWIYYCISALNNVAQMLLFAVVFFGANSLNSTGLNFASLEFRPKGLSITRGQSSSKLISWDKLQEVEIRNRRLTFVPNYICFKYQSGGDDLLLLEDITKNVDATKRMDVTTLVEKIRTWAPQTKISGDSELRKLESLASYTELWLKDLSTQTRRISAAQRLEAGATLNEGYLILQILSGGGQGTAYKARCTPTAAIKAPPVVVLKEFILPENSRGLARAKENLQQEVQIMRRIQHASIVKLYDSFIEDLRGYLVVEFVDGMTLKELVYRQGIPPDSVIARFGKQVCEALHYLHNMTPPVIHGDVTPDNIMVQVDGTVKLLDFDAAQEVTKGKIETVIGKHSYMSPEQFRGEPTTRSDIYSLGGTLHFLLTGIDPEPITQSNPASVRRTASGEISKLVMHATELDENKRISSADDLRQALERF